MSAPKLHKRDLNPDPFAQFAAWFSHAKRKSGLVNPNAFALSTRSASMDGWPEVRMVLLKEASPRGFVFYTNFESDKGLAILADPRVELDFFWEFTPLPSKILRWAMEALRRPTRIKLTVARAAMAVLGPLGRQIRVRGKAAPVSDAEADHYFASRPRASQLGAWASRQSGEVESREAMDTAFTEMERKFRNVEVSRPPHWSGFRVVPERFEFWQADPFRFHDRFRYIKDSAGWKIMRVYP